MSQTPKQHRLPLRFIDGAFELQFGGAVPLFDGTLCELIVTEDKISDPKLLESLSVKKAIKILDEGTKLVAMLLTCDPKTGPFERRICLRLMLHENEENRECQVTALAKSRLFDHSGVAAGAKVSELWP